MREELRKMEALFPMATRQTVAIRHAMIEMLSFVNAVKASLASSKMVGSVAQDPTPDRVEDTPLFAGQVMTQPDEFVPAQEWKEMWTGERIAAVPVKKITPQEEQRMLASLRRAGDHSLDAQEPDHDRHVAVEPEGGNH